MRMETALGSPVNKWLRCVVTHALLKRRKGRADGKSPAGPEADSARSNQEKAPHLRGFLATYLLRPDPGPVGVNVDPLGEGLAPTVLPDGFMEL